MTRYAKFLTALASALGVLGAGLGNGSIGTAEIVAAVVAFLGAIGVYQIPNKPPGTP